jgi:uncharacterized membrane protein YdfJ with MMPL/SSD domain
MSNEDRKPQVSAPAVTPTAPAGQSIEQLLAATLAQLAAANQQNAESNKQLVALMEQQAAYNKAALKIAPKRRKTMQEFLAERKKAGRIKWLKHDVYQNGRLVNPKGLSQETLDILDTLNTGVYAEGLVHLVRIKDGVNGLTSRIHIMYNNKTLEERMVFYMKFPTFTQIVTTVSDEMKTRGIEFVHEPGADAPAFDFPDELADIS